LGAPTSSVCDLVMIWSHVLQYGLVKEEYIIKVPKDRAPEGLKVKDQVGP